MTTKKLKLPNSFRQILTALGTAFAGTLLGSEDFPIVPEDVEVALYAKDPLVRNPCVITFDSQGRLCVGMGPQYRAPGQKSPADSVWIVTDEDGDGLAETRKEFATGFNSVQGLAWKGDWLWVANAPELTRVRDTNGDDLADEYIRVYTDLGNLEHALHGLNFGPDGRLYMSKGNSKGLTILPDRLAPSAFRELWGIQVPKGTPEPQPKTFNRHNYEKNYQNPSDDWGVTGGILRCDEDGSNLEIVARGFRNPWDITFDDHFDWLGTDNDQTMGDKIFAPFYGSHFGWGHAWSYDWKGDDHLPTAPSSGPLFEGSGAGIIHCKINGYPNKYNDVFLISDWLNREVFIYRSKWDGAWRKPDRDKLEIFAHAGGGRSMALSSGRAFDPVDIEMGPDGAIWITSWGRQYGAHFRSGKLANEGRIYRFWPKGYLPETRPGEVKSMAGLVANLGSHLPAWRTNAQDALIQEGLSVVPRLKTELAKTKISKGHETWLVWTIGRIDPATWLDGNQNQLIQSIRVAAFNQRMRPEITGALKHSEPRIRLEAVLALRQISPPEAHIALLDLAEVETDRIVNYAIWGALTDLLSVEERKKLRWDKRSSIRLAALLGLLEEDALTEEEIEESTKDSHVPIKNLAKKRLGGKHRFEHRGRPLEATGDFHQEKPWVVPFENVSSSSGRTYLPAVLQAGVPYYTDRDYRITKVPPELQNLTFLQTACADADASSGITVAFELKYPSTVYFIDDARAEALPAWERGKWKSTSLIIEGEDPKVMKVYKADLSAGPIELGTSRDGIKARKGNYIVAFRPQLLQPDGKLATPSSVIPLLAKADPNRGRDLFFGTTGANCASCHQVGDLGNNHAPDLSEIGSRANASSLISSILEPSANIVEGFAAQMIETHSGKNYSGIILRETGLQVTMAMVGGSVLQISRKEIKHRKSLEVSAMPAGYGAILTSHQIADLTAWLLSLKKPRPTQFEEGEFTFRKDNGKLDLFWGPTQVATYLLKHERLTRRAFVNLRTPSGIQVTRNFPPRRPEDVDPGYRHENGIIHPMMHPGLWMSFGWIDGNDYWRLASQVKFEQFLDEPKGGKGEASFSTRDRYLDGTGKKTVCLQDTLYRFRKVKQGILLDWDSQFYNDEKDFVFGDQEESGLALRIASPLRVKGGNGSIVNDRGEMNGAGTWGKPFNWISYSGRLHGKQIGLLVAPHPQNPRSSWSHSRDYGVLVTNPFPKQPRERREPYVRTTVPKGDRYRLRYKVLIHEMEVGNFNPQELANQIRKTL